MNAKAIAPSGVRPWAFPAILSLAVLVVLAWTPPASAQFGLNCPGTWIPYGGGQACQCPDGSLANYVGGQVVCSGAPQSYNQQHSAPPGAGLDQAIGNIVGGLFDGLSNMLPASQTDQGSQSSDEETGSGDSDTASGDSGDSYVDRMTDQTKDRLRGKVGPDHVYSARQGYMGPGKYRHCDGSLWHHATFEDHFSRLKSISCGGVPAPTLQTTTVQPQRQPSAAAGTQPGSESGFEETAKGILDGMTRMLPFLNQQQPAATSGDSYVDRMTNETQRNLRQKVGPNHIFSARQGYMGPGKYRHCDGSLRYYRTSEAYWALMKQLGC